MKEEKKKSDIELLAELVRLQKQERVAAKKQKEATILISAALLLIALFQLITSLLPLPESNTTRISILVFVLVLVVVTITFILKDHTNN